MSGFGLEGTHKPYRVVGSFGRLATLLKPLYESTGYTVQPGVCPVFYKLYSNLGIPELPPATAGTIVHRIRVNKLDMKHVVLCFSGGKDSTAAAVALKAAGYRVTGFFLDGISKAYHDEKAQCRKLAGQIGIDLIIQKFCAVGDHPRRVNQLKNQMMLAMAIDFGVGVGAGSYAMGNCGEDWLHPGGNAKDEKELLFTLTDTMDMHCAAKEIYEWFVPGIEILATVLPRKADSFFLLAKHAPELLALCPGCILPPFRRPNPRKANIRKFGQDVLLPGQCGSCYKCACEYVYFARMGALPMHTDYYNLCMGRADTQFNTLTDWTGKAPTKTFPTDKEFAKHKLDPVYLGSFFKA